MKKYIVSILLATALLTSNTRVNANILNPLDHKVMYFGGISVITLSGTYMYLLNNPDKIDNYISKKPKEALLLLAYVEWRINTTKSDEKRKTFINFKNYLDLGLTEWRSLEIEKDPLWISIRDKVIEKIKEQDEELIKTKKEPICKVNDLQKILLKDEDFNNNINFLLPKTISNPTHFLNVDSYFKLKENYSNKSVAMQHDHIPSFAAIEKFLESHGISTKTTMVTSQKTGKKYKVRDKDVENNESAISIPEILHQEGSRTFGGRNTLKQIKNDAQDLKAATIKDITTIAYFLHEEPKYNINYENYIAASMTLYLRNKMLCLYDI